MVWSIPRSPDGDERGLAGIAEMYGLIEKNEKYINNSSPIPFAAVLSSTQTGEWYVKETEPDWDEEITGSARRYKYCFQGISKALLKNHIPFSIILDGHMNADYLSRYKILFLPNAACLSDRQCDEISRFVREGGGLIATYESSLYDEKGNRRGDFGLKDVFGCHYLKDLGEQNKGKQLAGYMEIEIDHPVIKSYQLGFKFPIGGNYLSVSTFGESQAIAKLLTPTRYYCDFYGKKTDYPGVVVNHCGKGKVVYIPGEMGLTYYERGFVEHKRLIENSIRWITGGELPIETDLPETVEISIMEVDDGTTIIHLINCTADLSCPIEKIVPVFQGKVKIKLPEKKNIKKLFSIYNKENLEYNVEKSYVVITLPPLYEYEMIVFQS